MRAQLPHNVRVRYIAQSVGRYRPEFLFHQAGDEEDQTLVVDGPRSDRPVGILDLPEFFAGARVVTISRLGAGAEHLRLSPDRRDQRRAVGLA